ncbi:hypothetical protein D9756_009662 [Leucocoprinus leucothites]|uniref:Uncharacterized protein n=1 Tax=Leucocoprinus leucothites TaxID=201217 RepID=A0A8H5CV03_9AGAR|nr:hypothetical protein D9756_009662 [Leucoagaricus leucothites]
MTGSIQLSIDDTSPTLAYAPFGDTFTGHPNLSAGWNPYSIDNGFGIGESQHVTSRNGTSVTLEWHGTSVQIFGDTTSDVSLNVTLDGSTIFSQRSKPIVTNNLLVSVDGLPNAHHSMTLVANIPSSSNQVPDGFQLNDFANQTIDDKDIDFSGQWSLIVSNDRPAVHPSNTQGATAEITFSGIPACTFGITSQVSGNYSVTLDGTQSPILSARSFYNNTDTLLYFASGLDVNATHQLTLRNEGGLLQFQSPGGFVALSPSSSTSDIPSPTVALDPGSDHVRTGWMAAIIGGVIGGFAVIIITVLLLWWYKRRQRPTSEGVSPFSLTEPPPQVRFRVVAAVFSREKQLPQNTSPAGISQQRESDRTHPTRKRLPQSNSPTATSQQRESDRAHPNRFAVDAGPVDDGRSSLGDETFPPQYEQVLRSLGEPQERAPLNTGQLN